ncbi:hypothetical protein L917_02400 [Phytophthora nicotianae]|uniref:Uncharacterized protein n=1 Tax=Phytophthora nicotianae TaxID=4792 RepID=W2LW86_PHYNI|nr:hypothetical protein L917_02400 [Phytophthora nicotianae]
MGRGRRWSTAEDEVLIRAYLHISQSPIDGMEQKAATFWKNILDASTAWLSRLPRTTTGPFRQFAITGSVFRGTSESLWGAIVLLSLETSLERMLTTISTILAPCLLHKTAFIYLRILLADPTQVAEVHGRKFLHFGCIKLWKWCDYRGNQPSPRKEEGETCFSC